jgi:hypothetical protein
MATDKLCFLAPSRVESSRRLSLACASLKSLRDNGGSGYPMYVVQDEPCRSAFLPRWAAGWLPAVRYSEAGAQAYIKNVSKFIRRHGAGSASALLEAAEAAVADDCNLGYIHLDDHVYHPHLRQLLLFSEEEMCASSNLIWLRFSGYPLISQRGREFSRSGQSVAFDSVVLVPHSRGRYTLWTSDLGPHISEGAYWPVAMWHSVYRLPVLCHMLRWALEQPGVHHLADVEVLFKSDVGTTWLCEQYPNCSFGYINMQFAGFEMHRNKSWKKLLSGLNAAEL